MRYHQIPVLPLLLHRKLLDASRILPDDSCTASSAAQEAVKIANET